MPRDASGNYTLPAGNPVLTGTTITSDWANSTMVDVGNEITNSLSRDGQGGMNVPLQFVSGNEVEPAMTYVQEPTLGWFRQGVAVMSLGALGDEHLRYDANTNTYSVFGTPTNIPKMRLETNDVTGVPNYQIRDGNQFLRFVFQMDLDVGQGAIYQNDGAGVRETTLVFKNEGNVSVNGAAPIDAADLTRKDYVDSRTTIKPVGALEFGYDPNGVLFGTWTQLPEGAFIMNTVGGSDPSGGSNDAVNIAHTHADAGAHTHATDSQGSHAHNIDATNGGAGGQETDRVQNGLNTGTNNNSAIDDAGAHTHTALSSGTHGHPSAGVSGTNLNKPLYVGVEIWQRTA